MSNIIRKWTRHNLRTYGFKWVPKDFFHSQQKGNKKPKKKGILARFDKQGKTPYGMPASPPMAVNGPRRMAK